MWRRRFDRGRRAGEGKKSEVSDWRSACLPEPWRRVLHAFWHTHAIRSVKFADKSRHAFEALLDRRHAGRVADPQAVVGTEGDSRDGGDLLLLQQAGAEVGALESGAGDVGKEVKGPLGIDARDAAHRVQPVP